MLTVQEEQRKKRKKKKKKKRKRKDRTEEIRGRKRNKAKGDEKMLLILCNPTNKKFPFLFIRVVSFVIPPTRPARYN